MFRTPSDRTLRRRSNNFSTCTQCLLSVVKSKKSVQLLERDCQHYILHHCWPNPQPGMSARQGAVPLPVSGPGARGRTNILTCMPSRAGQGLHRCPWAGGLSGPAAFLCHQFSIIHLRGSAGIILYLSPFLAQARLGPARNNFLSHHPPRTPT